MTWWRRLAFTGTATAVSAGLGVLATTPETDWYAALDKPSWDPPTLAYPLVWTPLYADLAVTSALALEQMPPEEAAAYRRAFVANLVLNTGWSVLFWRVRRPWLSTVWCGVLAASSLDLVRRRTTSTRGCTTPWRRTPPGARSRPPSTASIARRNLQVLRAAVGAMMAR